MLDAIVNATGCQFAVIAERTHGSCQFHVVNRKFRWNEVELKALERMLNPTGELIAETLSYSAAGLERRRLVVFPVGVSNDNLFLVFDADNNSSVTMTPCRRLSGHVSEALELGASLLDPNNCHSAGFAQ